MSLIHRLYSLLSPKTKSPLRIELRNLLRNINKTDRYLSDLSSRFWESGGVCCPSCGVPGFSDLQSKQERRRNRLQQLQKKLNLG